MNAPMTTRTLAPSVAMTLDVLAAEIELAGARCIFLDRIIGEVMDGLPERERERLMEGLHGVDLLAQHLTSLSAFARGLSLAMPGDVTVPVLGAISEVTLGALAERMTAGLGGDDGEGDDATAGDLDLF
ncbi:MAG: hypothetical protein EPO51_04070 [Phenylobacterium sp.]|uniref:hypothetical protein n=1 Tax=Phenylobacterium sp. TaxID=1871053 RepID=UPI00120C4CC7|nr:hypothetical protein [Phenylobacterium sp.]TAJ73662.1 MAG: hypothetical protein EPO51_04070 [Phenylobacterium sp.]